MATDASEAVNAATEAAASAKVAAAQAAAATTAAQQAAAQTGIGQTDVSAGYRSAGADVTSDVGQAEAYLINMKKLVENALDHSAELQNVSIELLRRSHRNAEDYDHALRQTAIQAVQNAVTLSNRVNNTSADLDVRIKNLSVDHDSRVRALQEGELARTVRHSDLAIDRQWNVDEVAELVSKTPVFLDAIAGAVASGVAQALAARETTSPK